MIAEAVIAIPKELVIAAPFILTPYIVFVVALRSSKAALKRTEAELLQTQANAQANETANKIKRREWGKLVNDVTREKNALAAQLQSAKNDADSHNRAFVKIAKERNELNLILAGRDHKDKKYNELAEQLKIAESFIKKQDDRSRNFDHMHLEIKEVEAELSEAEKKLQTAENDLHDAEIEIQRLEEKLEDTDAEKQGLQDRIGKLEHEVEVAESERDTAWYDSSDRARDADDRLLDLAKQMAQQLRIVTDEPERFDKWAAYRMIDILDEEFMVRV